jgi:hypothetical protein
MLYPLSYGRVALWAEEDSILPPPPAQNAKAVSLVTGVSARLRTGDPARVPARDW